MKGKKGALVLSQLTLFELILGAIVVTMFISAASSIGDIDKLNNFAISSDVAYLLEATQATPHDVYYEYPETSYGSDLFVGQEKVSVLPRGSVVTEERTSSLTEQSYSKSSFISLESTTVNAAFFIINKQQNELSLIQEKQKNTLLLENTLDVDKENIRIFVVPSQNSQLTPIENSFTGKLQYKEFVFSLEDEANFFITFSSQQDGTIYHSSNIETKQLAQQLQQSLSGIQNFLIIQGTKNLEDNNLFIEFSLAQELLPYSIDDTELFTTFLVNGFENFYE